MQCIPLLDTFRYIVHVGVSKNRGGPPKSSILMGFSLIFTIHFGVSLFLETPMYILSTHIVSLLQLDDPGCRALERAPKRELRAYQAISAENADEPTGVWMAKKTTKDETSLTTNYHQPSNSNKASKFPIHGFKMKNVSRQLSRFFGLLLFVTLSHLVYIARNLVILPYHAKVL